MNQNGKQIRNIYFYSNKQDNNATYLQRKYAILLNKHLSN